MNFFQLLSIGTFCCMTRAQNHFIIFSSGAGIAVPTVMVTTSAGTFLAPLLGMAETSDPSPQEEVQVRQPRSQRSSEVDNCFIYIS